MSHIGKMDLLHFPTMQIICSYLPQSDILSLFAALNIKDPGMLKYSDVSEPCEYLIHIADGDNSTAVFNKTASFYDWCRENKIKKIDHHKTVSRWEEFKELQKETDNLSWEEFKELHSHPEEKEVIDDEIFERSDGLEQAILLYEKSDLVTVSGLLGLDQYLPLTKAQFAKDIKLFMQWDFRNFFTISIEHEKVQKLTKVPIKQRKKIPTTTTFYTMIRIMNHLLNNDNESWIEDKLLKKNYKHGLSEEDFDFLTIDLKPVVVKKPVISGTEESENEESESEESENEESENEESESEEEE